MTRKSIPRTAERVRKYAEYRKHCKAFLASQYQLFVAIGRPGIGKSHYFKRNQGRKLHIISGFTTALEAYILLYRHRNKLIVIDDAESLWANEAGRMLIRSLTEHTSQKLLRWQSTTSRLEKEAVPQEFETSSRVAIIANHFRDDEEYKAILDRGQTLLFDPDAVEIHRDVARWFWDQEIHDYIGDHLHSIENLSARLYLKAYERKQAGVDWEKLIQGSFCNPKVSLVLQLHQDSSLATATDRWQRFVDSGRGSRATYFNLVRRLRSNGQLELARSPAKRYKVRGNAPSDGRSTQAVA